VVLLINAGSNFQPICNPGSIKAKCSYFTMPHENTVYKFVDSKLSNSSVAFKTTGRCYGITGFADGLAVSMAFYFSVS